MFALSSRFGALADRFGPRLFMGAGPLIAGAGMFLLLTIGVHVHYLTEVLPGVLLFSLGLSITVAPLTAAILAGVEIDEAGIGSAVNNAVARVAGLIATVAVGALVAAQFSSSLDRHLAGRPLTPRGQAAVAQAKRLTFGRPSVAGVPPREAVAITVASNQSSLEAFRLGVGVAGTLVIIGGLIGAAGISNPRRVVPRRTLRRRAARGRPTRRRRTPRSPDGLTCSRIRLRVDATARFAWGCRSAEVREPRDD